MSPEPLLEVDGLEVVFHGRDADGRPPVRGVSFTVDAGERLGLVGESGSGKSLTALAILGLVPGRGEITSGRVRIDGADAATVGNLRGGVVGLVLQEATAALNPVFTVGFQLVETIAAHGIARGAGARRRALELLAEAAVEDPDAIVEAYPHQLSGGQAQRVAIALALAGEPKVVVADEPTTALDVVTQARILDLLVRITDQRRLGLVLVSHDLAVIAGLVHRLLVMDRGRVVESGPTEEVLRHPRHPVTRRLVEAALALRRPPAPNGSGS